MNPPQEATADVVVIGLGAVGSAIAHHLAKGGARVVGIDRLRPPHEHGSSHGATRITRLAIGEGHEYVPIARRSHELWRELESAQGVELMLRTGGLVIGTPASRQSFFHGRPGFFDRTVDAARRFGIDHEMLDADELGRRFPAFLLDGDEIGYLEHDAGVLRPEACVAAQLAAAAACGATMRLDERVTSVAGDGSAVRVATDRGSIVAGHAVLACGPWLPSMLGGDWLQRLAVQRQVLYWYAVDRPELYRRGALPIFIRLLGSAGEHVYGFPMVDGHAGVKIATEQIEHRTDPDRVDRAVGAVEASAFFDDQVAGRLRGLRRDLVHAATCLYTSTLDGRFVVDRHPTVERATIVSACSGHGFKHSAALGEAIAARILGAEPGFDLSAFAVGAQSWNAGDAGRVVA